MSRIGKKPITLPANTSMTIAEGMVSIAGSKGSLQVALLKGVTISQQEQELVIERETETDRAMQGLFRTLVQNAVTGVSEGWKKDLELHGVGMRATVNGNTLTLGLGFSHPVIITAPEGISFVVTKNVITVSGIDKQLVGEISAQIRKLRKPEPYKGKGIRYSTEYVRRKAGKTGKGAK